MIAGPVMAALAISSAGSLVVEGSIAPAVGVMARGALA